MNQDWLVAAAITAGDMTSGCWVVEDEACRVWVWGF